MFGLDLSGEWEDLVLDKEKNKATITRCSWCDKLCSRTPEKYTTVMKLSDIRHVGVSLNLGLFLLHRSGKTASISTQDLTREEIQNLRREVNYFLNTSRIEYLDKYTTDPYDRLLTPSDSEDEFLQGLSTIRQPISILKDSPVFNRAQDDAERSEERQQIELQRSSSSLSNQRQSETSRRVNQRRGPYTDNSARDIYPRCTRHNCMASSRLEIVEASR